MRMNAKDIQALCLYEHQYDAELHTELKKKCIAGTIPVEKAIPATNALRKPTLEEALQFAPMICPFVPDDVVSEMTCFPKRDKDLLPWPVVPYGTTRDGVYSPRLEQINNLKHLISDPGAVSDPLDHKFILDNLKFSEPALKYVRPGQNDNPYQRILIAPGETLVGRTMEFFDIPRGCMVVPMEKPHYTNIGVRVHAAPLLVGDYGQLYFTITLEPWASPAVIYLGGGILDLVFEYVDPSTRTLFPTITK